MNPTNSLEEPKPGPVKFIMATEGKSEETQIEQKNEQLQEQEKEPSKNVNEKEDEKENVKDAENKDEPEENSERKPEESVVTEEKNDVAETENGASANEGEPCSFNERGTGLLSELNENEKNALSALRSKIEGAILANKFMKEKKEKEKDMSVKKDGKQEENSVKEVEEKEKPKQVVNAGKEEQAVVNDDTTGERGEKEKIQEDVAEKEAAAVVEKINQQVEAKQNVAEEGDKEASEVVKEEKGVDVDKDISLWGVPLLPSKGDERTDVILLKFLRARDFKPDDAFQMLRNTLQWRKENNIDTILDEDLGPNLHSMAYMEGSDRKGNPICYNIIGVLGKDDEYNKALGNEALRQKFLRWRIQLMEKGIKKLDFKPGGVSTILQINDLYNTPGPMKRELRHATRKAVELLQDNYPEFVEKNIFINVPFWYYAFSALLSPFLTQRTKNKFVSSLSAKVTDTLLKYIAPEEIPVKYGGLKRDTDSEFSVEDGSKEASVKLGSTETIEIPAQEAGSTLIWDVTVSGWEVNYGEEFVPNDDKSYTVIVQKRRKIGWQEGWQEGPIRNSYKCNEPGKVVITFENGSFRKKHILYRHKIKNPSSSTS